MLGAWAGAFLAFTLLVVDLAFLSSVLIWPFSRRAFRVYNRRIADTWWRTVLGACRVAWGMRLRVSGDPVPAAENAILIVNHQQMVDIPCIALLAMGTQRLGDLKWFAKDPIKYVPGLGWGMLFLDNIFLKRRWTEDKASIEHTFGRLRKHGLPFWLVSFSEGTRFTRRKVEDARSFAAERGLPPPAHVLLPRTRGFQAMIVALRDRLDAVYDLTIAYPDGLPTFWQFVCGMGQEASIHFRRYPMAEVPSDPDALATWLRDRFVEKDTLLAGYFENGEFRPQGSAHADR